MGQDVMPSGLASPSLPHLPPRERVFLPGLYSDVELRLDRVDCGIDALRRRVRDFDSQLDGQIRRCETAEDRVRSLRDDFSRIDREISEMSAELNSTFDNGDNDSVEDIEYDCNIHVSTRNSLRTDPEQPIITNSSDFVQTQEELTMPVSNRTSTHGVTIRINTDSQPEESTPQIKSGCDIENDKKSTTCNREQSAIEIIDNSGNLIHQENNLVSIGVICNVNEPTDVPTGSNECSRCVSDAEQQLLDMAQDLTDFRRAVSSSTRIDNSSDDCLLEARFSRDEEEGGDREQGIRKEKHHTEVTSAKADIGNENEKYAAFDSYVQEIIKRHSSENCKDLVESEDNLKSGNCSEKTDQHLCHNESQLPAGNYADNQSDRSRDDVTRSQNGVRSEVTIDSQQCEGQAPDSQDLTSSTLTADEYTADETSGISEPCRHESRSRGESASQSSHICRRRKTWLPNKCAKVQFKHRGRRASRRSHCCLRNVLATYVHSFLELLHSRVTKEVKKGSKGKHHSGSERRHVSNDDIVSARDAVFTRLGLTVPMLEVLLKFDQDNLKCLDHAQIDPVYVTDDEVHKLLVLMGMSWNTMNDRLHENDLAFRVAIATVHADLHQAE